MSATLAERAYVHLLMETHGGDLTIAAISKLCTEHPNNTWGEPMALGDRLPMVVDDLCASGDAWHSGGRGINKTYQTVSRGKR